jgi:hypothetical protein
MTNLRHTPLESARFGLRVFRAEADTIDAAALVDTLQRERVDVAILRLPADAVASLNALREYDLAPIVADTIVCYEIDLPATQAEPDDAVTLRDATPADAVLLESLAREIFTGYITHYHANPLFPAAKILDGYSEWAASHVRGERAGAAWLVESNGKVAGFSCYRIDDATGLAIGVLNGVLPAFRGRGVYRGMLRCMLHEFGGHGLTRFAIATQVQNVAVQRIWVAEGLTLTRTDNTVHVNAMLGRSGTLVSQSPASP